MFRPMRTGLLAAGLGIAVLMPLAAQRAPSLPSRQSFDIAAGSLAGHHYPIVELIARSVSHPPGLARCEKPGVCAPPGLIVSTRSSEGALANARAVESGQVASGLAPSNLVADAVAGRGAFRKVGRQKHIRVAASLFPETMQLVVAARSKIKTVRGLRRQRVSLGRKGSGGESVALAVLSAYGVSQRSLKLRRENSEAAARLLRQGKLDAFFYLGAAPSPVIANLVTRGSARLVPISGTLQRRLLARQRGLSAASIPTGAYGNTAPIASVGCRILWIVKDSTPPATVYGLVRALYHPANRATLAAGSPPLDRLSLAEAVKDLTAPLHPGAESFYREMGKLPARPARRK